MPQVLLLSPVTPVLLFFHRYTPYKWHLEGPFDVFVAQVYTIGSRLLFSNFLAGKKRDTVSSIAVDSEGNIYVAGNTDPATFP